MKRVDPDAIVTVEGVHHHFVSLREAVQHILAFATDPPGESGSAGRRILPHQVGAATACFLSVSPSRPATANCAAELVRMRRALASPEVNAGDETASSSRKDGEETRQIGRVFFELPGTRSDGG
ncbi:hypothetical protein [Streptomyces sp. NPDC056948]|uniref:hypothetical protein n=1 Tax=Streptomyces sp. NPDC056948 TaxID=3345975 RepID=UPI00363667A4